MAEPTDARAAMREWRLSLERHGMWLDPDAEDSLTALIEQREAGLRAESRQLREVLKTTWLHLIALAGTYPQDTLIVNLRDSHAEILRRLEAK